MTNLEKMKTILHEGTVDALLLTSQVGRLYAACYDVAEGVAVIGKEKNWYFTDSRYIEVAQENLKGFQVEEVDRSRSYPQRINDALKELGAGTLGIEEDFLTHGEFLYYREKLSAELVPCQKKISAPRHVKEEWEIQRMIRAQEITDQAFTEMLRVIRPGMKEKELAAELIYSLYKNGADELSFQPIAVSGPNTSKPHGVPGERILQNGDFITMDFGCKVDGYCSDMTRTVALGSVTDEMKAVYETVLRAQMQALSVTKAGMTGREIDAAARRVIEAAGYGPYFGHGYGHSLGLEIHEAPNCNSANDQPMPVGAVCSAEPGIYLPGKFGVRIEDVVILTADGCRNMTHSPKDLIII